MFTLWYTVLSWKEYRDVILERLSSRPPPPVAKSKQADIPVCPLPKKTEPPRMPPAEPPRPPQTPPKTIPTPPPIRPAPPPKLDPLAKPPRSPSPHPLRAEAFEDIEYDEDDSEDEDEDEEDEDSVIDSLPTGKPLANSVNDFINVERDIASRQRYIGNVWQC